MATKKVFITGAAGCVGHYLVDLLTKDPEYKLFLLVRNPQKILFEKDAPNIEIIKDDFKNIKKYENIIKDSDYVIHLLADWGNEFGNYDETITFFECIDPARIKKIIYFSTASILGKDNKPDKRVLTCGTGYIRGKYKMYQKILSSPLKDKVVTLYPTWVLGGDKAHPYSHATMAVKNAKKWFPLLTFLDIDLKFHFIHAADIAKITTYLLPNDTNEKEFVLGTKVITAGTFIDEIIGYFGFRRPFRLKITGAFAKIAERLLGNRISEWDRYCLNAYHQEFSTVDPSYFGLTTSFPSAKSIIKDIFGGK